MIESIEQLYENWRILAERFQISISCGDTNNAQLEWPVDKAFMKYVKALKASGAKVDMAAARSCIGQSTEKLCTCCKDRPQRRDGMCSRCDRQ